MRAGVEQEPTVEVSRPSTGLSSETVFLDVTWPDRTERLVARMPPTGSLSFPDYDLRQQHDVQLALAKTDIPVVEPIAYEDDESFIGAAFLLMPRIEGQLLKSVPSYVSEGWLRDFSPADQGRMLGSFLSLLGDIHSLPVDAAGTSLSGGGPTLEGALDYWESFVGWATTDEAGAQVYRDGLAWLRANLPNEVPAPSLLWGDPQLTNVVFDEQGEVVVVLDWEMATTGPAELDIAWFLVLHELAVEVSGGVDLPGFPDRRTMLDWYELALGRTVADLHWYELFANVRTGAIVLRLGELMRRAGAEVSWTAHIPQPRHIRRLIGA